MRLTLWTLVLLAAGAGAILWAGERGVGRRLWYPGYRALAGPRTHAGVLARIGPARRPELEGAASGVGVAYPPATLTLVGLKSERRLEAWAPAAAGEKALLRSWPILAASGDAGPKLREGDRQVPEGVYRLTGFNPNSSYHLSIRVDYPSAADRAIAAAEGRDHLGGDIFIHGKAVSIGCLAIGDDAIEELYVLLADVGLPNTRLLLSPVAEPEVSDDLPEWLRERYRILRQEIGQLHRPRP